MYFPKRKEKTLTLPKYSEKSSIDNESIIIEDEEIQEFLTEKEKLKVEIDEKLKPALENITISQINRFYSILESRKFSLDSNYIKNVIDKQIERKIIDEEKIEDFEKEKNFYKLFKKNFLTENFLNDRKRCFILMNLIKSYVKYYIGNQRIKEKREKERKHREENMDFSTFQNKYVIKGELVILTALHIGSGKEEAEHDAPFINSNGEFIIPGSSFRGYLSTKLERLLDIENNFNFIEKKTKERLNFGDVKLIFGYTNLSKDDKNIKNMDEIRERIKKRLGIEINDIKEIDSMAGRIHIADMPIISEVESIKRDGIKINRDTGATEKGAKFDYDVIPAGAKFKLYIELNNIEDYQLELIGLALKDIVEDGDLFGGKLSRGIGKCIIPKETLKVSYVDSQDRDALENYIFKGEMRKGDTKILFDIKNLTLELK